MSKNNVKINSIIGFLSHIIILICGLILPRLILSEYGSDVNGLVNSITSFLDVITLLEFGIGSATQAVLYKPLCENNVERVSKIYNYIKRFYRWIGTIFILYVIVLAISLSLLNINKFDFLYTFLLIISMAITFFSQYYFGLANAAVISADQKVYITYILNSTTILLNTISCYFLIKLNVSIQILKLTTSIIYLIRPIVYTQYVKKTYKIRKIKPDGDEVPQRWYAFAQHIAAFLLSNIDIIILTIFSTLSNISIYSVYYMILKAIYNLIFSFVGGVKSYYGHLISQNKYDELKNAFNKYFWLISSISIIIYSITIIMMVPFVKIYTIGINDADYNQPVFSILLIVSQLLFLYRSILHIVITAAGHFKQTQLSSILEVVINIIVSLLFINFWELIGIAIGTVVAMLYRTIQLTIYISKNIISKAYKIVAKQLAISLIFVVISSIISIMIPINSLNYIDWVINSIIISSIVAMSFIIFTVPLYFKEYINFFRTLKRR